MTDPANRVEGLTKRFGSVTALDGIDLEIPSRTEPTVDGSGNVAAAHVK